MSMIISSSKQSGPDALVTKATQAIALPAPRVGISVRPGTMEDISFIDALQKKHTKLLGFMPRAQLEGKIRLGHVLVAEALDEPRASASGSGERSEPLPYGRGSLGYVIGNDQYFKHDDVGIIYQLCVAPTQRRGLIGAALVKAMFERSAYGCRLFCCWCAQDIEANHFWESLGFVPLAFRAGSRKKSRVHIFWQKRIRKGDTETPYWFPSQTTGGLIREDRLVLPIKPGTHWSDIKPMILPRSDDAPEAAPQPKKTAPPVQRWVDPIAHLSPAERRKLPVNITGGLRFMVPAPAPVKPEKPKRTVRKNDPKYVAAARELRDRYLEEVARNPNLVLPMGKYDVARALPDLTQRVEVFPAQIKQLPLAA